MFFNIQVNIVAALTPFPLFLPALVCAITGSHFVYANYLSLLLSADNIKLFRIAAVLDGIGQEGSCLYSRSYLACNVNSWVPLHYTVQITEVAYIG